MSGAGDSQDATDLIEEPIFVIGCNRSGTTLLFRNLSAHHELWSLYVEAREEFYEFFPVDPDEGDRVVDAPSADVMGALKRRLYEKAHNKQYFKDTPLLRAIPSRVFQRPLGRFYKGAALRLVEKTPSNCLRVPLLAREFPDARFIYLVRRGEAVVSSLMEGWCRWTGVEDPDDWTYSKWHYLVPPGWREWRDRPLEEICAFQWISSNEHAVGDLRTHCPDRTLLVRHEDTLDDPSGQYRRIADFCGLSYDDHFADIVGRISRRVFTTGGSPPERGKWRRLHEARILRVRDRLAELNAKFYPDSQP